MYSTLYAHVCVWLMQPTLSYPTKLSISFSLDFPFHFDLNYYPLHKKCHFKKLNDYYII